MSYMHRKLSIMTILIADDDPDDRMFLEQAMRQNGYNQVIRCVDDGEDLMAYLRREGKYSEQDAPWPNLLILDLNMPRKNGFQALQEIKNDPQLRRLPVIVMTTSSADEDVIRTYNLGVNSFVTKPFNFSRLVEMIGALKVYWMDTVKLP
ncbi:response regulator [Spirosoma luteolum]